jgi:hypothetical protein
MNQTAQVRPSFAEHMAQHEHFETIASQILDIFDNHATQFANYSRKADFSSMELAGDKVCIGWVIYWSGDTERGTISVPAHWFDAFDAAMVEGYVKHGAEEAKRQEEQRAAEASARLRQRELEAAMATVQAAGFEVHLPLKKD